MNINRIKNNRLVPIEIKGNSNIGAIIIYSSTQNLTRKNLQYHRSRILKDNCLRNKLSTADKILTNSKIRTAKKLLYQALQKLPKHF